MLCVGLDTDYAKIPACLKSGRSAGEAVIEFNKRIIDATAPYCVAFKPNLAFYECLGHDGLTILEKTVEHIRLNHPGQFVIADAKRGDIGNTARMYAKSYFETFDFDAVTLSPYMGSETVTVQNLEVARVDAARNLLLIKGAIPGAKGTMVTVKSTVK